MTEADASLPLNRAAAYEAVQAIEDPLVRHIAELVLAAATARLVRWSDESKEDHLAGLPEAPVDLLFLVRVVQEALRDGETIRKLAAGEKLDDLALGDY